MNPTNPDRRLRSRRAHSSIVLFAGLSLAACARDTPISGPPVYSTRIVKASDTSGVGSVSCPSTHRIVGGGCSCEGLGDVLFGTETVGNGIVCACYDFGPAGGAVTTSAICLTSSVAGTLKEGLTAPDPEVEALADQYRAQRRAQPAP